MSNGAKMMGALQLANPVTLTSVSGVLTLTGDSNSFIAGGTEPITSIAGGTDVTQGIYTITWNTARTLTNGASLKLIGGANRTTAIGEACVYQLSSGVVTELLSNVVNPEFLNIVGYGADASGAADSSAAIQSAINDAATYGKAVFIPHGTFKANGLIVPSNVCIFGDGDGSVLKQTANLINPDDNWTALLMLGTPNATVDRTTTAGNVVNIRLRDFQIKGNVDTSMTCKEHVELIAVFGVSGLDISNVTLYAPEGDGIYLSGQSNNGSELHNSNVYVSKVMIDGIARYNRNGISIIDCDGFMGEKLYIARTTVDGMPGPIDIEPNQSYSVIRDITIQDSELIDFCGSGINMPLYFGQTEFANPVTKLCFQRNRISSVYCNTDPAAGCCGIGLDQTRTDSAALTDANTIAMGLVIRENDIANVPYGIYFGGIKGARVEDNIIRSTLGAGITLGEASVAKRTVIDAKVRGNYVEACGRTIDGGGMLIGYATRCDVVANVFYDCGGASGSLGKGMGLYLAGSSSVTSYLNVSDNIFIKATANCVQAIVVDGSQSQSRITATLRNNKYLGYTWDTTTNQFAAYNTDENTVTANFTSSVLPDSFPNGISVSVVTSDSGLPGGYTSGMLRVEKYTNYAAATARGSIVQYFYPNSASSTSAVYYRKATDAANTWASWVGVTGTGNVVYSTSPTITFPIISSVASAAATPLTLNAAATGGYLQVGGTTYYDWTSSAFYPNVANSYALGTASNVWSNVYSRQLTSDSTLAIASAAASSLTVTAGTTGAVTVDSGTTGAVNLGTNANAKAVTVGNVTAGSTITLKSGSAGVAVSGTTAAGNAAAGYVGEVVSAAVAAGSAVAMTTATGKNVTSISLTAGDWDVEGNVNFTLASATTAVTSVWGGGISATSATLPSDGTQVYLPAAALTTSSTSWGLSLPRKRINVSATTTVYLVGSATFSAGTVSGYGSITARRVR